MDATPRTPFAPETTVLAQLGGKAGTKPAVVVNDEGGDTVHVRYETTRGEVFKDVKAEKILPFVEETAEEVVEEVADELPVRDVNEEADVTAVEVDGTVVAFTSHFELPELAATEEPAADDIEARYAALEAFRKYDDIEARYAAFAALDADLRAEVLEELHVDDVEAVMDYAFLSGDRVYREQVVNRLHRIDPTRAAGPRRRSAQMIVEAAEERLAAAVAEDDILRASDELAAARAARAALNVEQTPEATEAAPKARRRKATPAPAEVDAEGVPQLSTDEVRGICKRLVADFGPRAVLADGFFGSMSSTMPVVDELNAADRARVENEAHYQAGRVLQFLDQPTPEGWGVNRERRARGTRPAQVARVTRV